MRRPAAHVLGLLLCGLAGLVVAGLAISGHADSFGVAAWVTLFLAPLGALGIWLPVFIHDELHRIEGRVRGLHGELKHCRALRAGAEAELRRRIGHYAEPVTGPDARDELPGAGDGAALRRQAGKLAATDWRAARDAELAQAVERVILREAEVEQAREARDAAADALEARCRRFPERLVVRIAGSRSRPRTPSPA